MSEKTTCACCQVKLPAELTKGVHNEFRPNEENWFVFTQADCRLCGRRCCASCLTLDEICDTCKDTLELSA